LLATLLGGQIKELQPLQPPELHYHDSELDTAQRDAVGRAVATPDVCMIQGFPGTGKSRVVAEIILQEAQRGERILFLASTTAAPIVCYSDSALTRPSARSAVAPPRRAKLPCRPKSPA
jgi:predicted ATP-dependent serine protease